jgi:hypothetical protein
MDNFKRRIKMVSQSTIDEVSALSEEKRMEQLSSELKDCPFCGGNASRQVVNSILTVACDDCLVSYANHIRLGCLADEQWNTRTI